LLIFFGSFFFPKHFVPHFISFERRDIRVSVYHFHWNSFESQWFPVKKRAKEHSDVKENKRCALFTLYVHSAALSKWVREIFPSDSATTTVSVKLKARDVSRYISKEYLKRETKNANEI
jgi:hypothetical protein